MATFQEKTFDLLTQTGLNWSVSKEELVTKSGKATESYGIIRNDTGKWLATVGNQYNPFQNSELAETIIQATDGLGLVTTRGGSLCGDKKVYLQAELPDEYIGNSAVQRWITALNSHDESTATGFGSSSTVVICQNTFYKAFAGLEKFRHTLSARDRIKETIKDLRIAMQLDEKLMINFKTMADVNLKEEIFASVIEKCFKTTLTEKVSELSTRKLNILKKVNEAIDKEIQLEGNTLWGLFNGITRYTNHMATEPDNKDSYLMAGGGYRTNLVAFDTIMKWVEERSEKTSMVAMS